MRNGIIQSLVGHRGERSPRLRASVLGVDFLWENAGEDLEPVRVGMEHVAAAILMHSAPAMRRQKRSHVSYVDAMSVLADRVFFEAGNRDEHTLASDLVIAIADDQIAARHYVALGELESVRVARSRLVYEYGASADETGRARARPGVDRIDYGLDETWHLRPAGACRVLEVKMGDLKGRPDEIDWPHVHLLAVLIQIRFDLEAYLETGFLRVHRCDRSSCRAFFQSSRMSGRRQRFCCATCRASAARETPPVARA